MCRAVVLQIWHTYPGCQRFFLSLGATELSGEVAKASREADKHYSLWRSLPLASEKTSGIQGTVLVALKILRDILSFTRSFMINTRSLVGILENWDRKVIKTIPCYTADCFKSSCLQFLSECVWCNVTPDLYRKNCHATDIALTEQLGSNGFYIIFSDKFGL